MCHGRARAEEARRAVRGARIDRPSDSLAPRGQSMLSFDRLLAPLVYWRRTGTSTRRLFVGRDSMSGRLHAKLVVAAVVLPLVGGGTTVFLTSQQSLAGPACPGSVVFVGARGSGDKVSSKDLFGPTVSAVWREFQNRVPNAVARPVNYQAQSVWNAFLNGYAPSYGDGLSAMYDASYVPALSCGGDSRFRMVYAGFSQGAHVVGDYAQKLDPANRGDARELAALAGVALLGDPRFDASAQDAVGGGRGPGLFAAPLDYGINYGSRPAFGGNLYRKARSYCLPQDAVCDTPAFLLSHGLSIIGKPPSAASLVLTTALALADAPTVHNEEGAALGRQAGEFLADQVLASLERQPLQTTGSTSTSVASSSVAASSSTAPLTVDVQPQPSPLSTKQSTVSGPPSTTRQPSRSADVDVHAPPPVDPGQTPLPAGAVMLGGVDLEKYCQNGWGLHAHLRYSVAWGWRCGVGIEQQLGWHPGDQDVSVDDACAQQWPSNAKSHYRDYGDPNSWFCWTA